MVKIAFTYIFANKMFKMFAFISFVYSHDSYIVFFNKQSEFPETFVLTHPISEKKTKIKHERNEKNEDKTHVNPHTFAKCEHLHEIEMIKRRQTHIKMPLTKK